MTPTNLKSDAKSLAELSVTSDQLVNGTMGKEKSLMNEPSLTKEQEILIKLATPKGKCMICRKKYTYGNSPVWLLDKNNNTGTAHKRCAYPIKRTIR